MSAVAATRKMNDRELAVRSQLEVWHGTNHRLSELLFELSDKQLQKQISPDRNTGHYIIGHLAAVNDAMLPLLGFGDKRFPDLESAFLKNPENAGIERPTIAETRRVWADLLGVLRENFERLSGAIGSINTRRYRTDFENEPLRNRIAVLISRRIA